MRVLPAVLAHAGRVALDVPGLLRRAIERRREQQHDLRPSPDEVRADRVHRAVREPRRGRAGEHRPGLGDRVDRALVALRRAERRAVVVVPAPVPLAVPGPLQRATRGGPPRRGSGRPGRALRAPRRAARSRRGPRGGRSRARRSRRAPPAPRGSSRRSSRRSPMSGRPWAPEVSPRSRARTQCSKSEALLGRDARAARRRRARPARAPAPSRNGTRSSSTAGVAGGPDVVRHRVRQPEEVVRAAGARPPPARRVPPVLHVPLAELPRRRPQEVLAHQLRPRQRERHRVLELIAEPEGAAGLVVAGARPHPAAQVLVEEPAVHEDVEGVVGRPDLHRAERLLPRAPHRLERGVRGLGAAVPRDQLPDVRPRPSPRRGGRRRRRVSPGARTTRDLERRAGIEPRPEARRRARPARAPPAARASRSGRGRRCGRRSPSGAPRSRGRRPRAPRTRGSRRSWRGSPRSPRPAP